MEMLKLFIIRRQDFVLKHHLKSRKKTSTIVPFRSSLIQLDLKRGEEIKINLIKIQLIEEQKSNYTT